MCYLWELLNTLGILKWLVSFPLFIFPLSEGGTNWQFLDVEISFTPKIFIL